MERSKYIIVNTEKQATDFSVAIQSAVFSDNKLSKMFSIRPNIDRSKWAIIVDPDYKIRPRILRNINIFNTKFKVKLKKGRREKAGEVLKFKFKLENPNKLDPIEWELEDTLPKKEKRNDSKQKRNKRP